MKPETITRWGRWVQWQTPVLAWPFRRLAMSRLARWRNLAETMPHVILALNSSDAQVRQIAGGALKGLGESPASVDALCAKWVSGRDRRLGQIITECRYQATTPIELRVLSGLQAGRLEELAREGAEIVPWLASALADKDKNLAEGARRVLTAFATSDALVDYALNHAEGAVLLPIIDARRTRHSIEGRWFLYLALSGRFEEYLAADFEFETLRQEFKGAPPALQARIRESIVRAGETRMNPLFVAEKRQALLADLGDHDAEMLVQVNARNQNWEALFKFLRVLQVRHIQSAVTAMVQAGWEPEDAHQLALFNKLQGLLAAAGEAPKTMPVPVLANPVLQQWLARGEKEWAGEPEAQLTVRLREEVPPPDQIAALGALRARGRLGAELLAQAGRSPHWLVRLAVVGLGGKAEPVNDGGQEWFSRLQVSLDLETLWGLKPCHVTRDGLEALQEGLARLPDRRATGGLGLLEAVVAHYTAHDFEIEIGAQILVGEDSFELEARPATKAPR